jgi:hypothetical protein
VRLFHRTSAAEAILRDGFRDASGTYLTDSEHKGVWFSSVPLDVNEGADGDALLELHMPADVASSFEWVEAGKGYREFLIPAAVANLYGPPRQVPADEEADMPDLRFSPPRLGQDAG